ncbi:hypothetical protein HHO41_05185 [Bacillus sp. DNRA2]|uniref:hypothetical protein n=1 Tax=Bacillus sp. DNRA2 TaxID=2723053 RepID=UPI00145FAF74|nr:hypothetical protein [Bacillus sp. DNRA2]NMD69673.1 hypothetical protein [Bacillus sp. DNRA2]
MNPKKSDKVVIKAAQKNTATETTNATDLFVDTVWDQYEQGLERSKQFGEEREDAFLKSVKEVIKLNQEFRKSLTSFYQESKKTNNEIVKEISNNLPGSNETAGADLKEQISDVSSRIEDLTLTPIKSTFGLLDRIEKNIEEKSESYVEFARDSRQRWEKVTYEYVKQTRNSQKQLVNRFEESFKVLLNTK